LFVGLLALRVSRRVQFDEWDTVVEELRRFGESGDVTVEDDRVRIAFGSARVVVSRDGRVSTGMALHDFEATGGVELVVDHDSGSLSVDAHEVTYTFRRPGG
jgi:hypothetical protein